MQQWGAERIEQLAALVATVAPDEDLTADELLTALYDRPGTVIGDDDGTGVVAVGVGRDASGTLVASLRLLAVRADRRRQGTGSALLDVAEAWAAERGAQEIQLGGRLPFPLWPGVHASTGVAELGLSRGYRDAGEVVAYVVPSSFRAPAPAGVVVRRAISDDDVTSVNLAVASRWAGASDEVARALDHGTCHAAFATRPSDPDGRAGELVGVGCHSVTRAGWVGPLVVHPDWRRRGVGAALLGQICRDLMIAEFRRAELHGVDPAAPELVAFLEAVGAGPHRTYRTLVKSLG